MIKRKTVVVAAVVASCLVAYTKLNFKLNNILVAFSSRQTILVVVILN